MELRQLEYFIAVAEEASFTRGAKRVHISQPGISAQIRELERDLGATLIDRSGRTAGLTAAGAAALGHARAVLSSADAVRRAVEEVNGLIRGHVVVGMVTACTVTPLFDALSAFHRAHPGVEITLVEDNSEQLIDLIRAGNVDMALIGAAGSPPDGLESLPLISEPIVAVVPFDHPLAGLSRTTLESVTAYPVVSLPAGTGIRSVFDQTCSRQGVRPNIALHASAPAAVAGLALRGLGVGILSLSMAAAHRDRLATLTIEDADTPAILALVWAPPQSPALREVLVRCRREFAVSATASPGADGGDPAQVAVNLIGR